MNLEEHVDKMSKEFSRSREDVIENLIGFARMGYTEDDTENNKEIDKIIIELQKLNK